MNKIFQNAIREINREITHLGQAWPTDREYKDLLYQTLKNLKYIQYRLSQKAGELIELPKPEGVQKSEERFSSSIATSVESYPAYHPAYGVISLIRFQGNHPFVGMDVADSAQVGYEISISTAQRRFLKDTYTETFKPGEKLIQVSLSQHQFAEFITSAGVTAGVPCTINRHMDVEMPQPPANTFLKDTITAAGENANVVLEDARDEFLAECNELEIDIENSRINRAIKSTLQARVKKIKSMESIPVASAQWGVEMIKQAAYPYQENKAENDA